MNKYIKVGIVLIVIVGVIVGIQNFGVKKNDQNELKIGVISSLTGDFGAIGENMVKGIQVAKSVYEKKTGNKITLIIEDDSGDGVRGLSAFRKLSQSDDIDGLINFFTTTMDSIYGPAKEEGYPVMMEAFQANNVADDYVFQMTPGNDDVWPKYAAYIKSSGLDLGKVILIHSKDAAQESFAKSFAGFYGEGATLYSVSSDKNSLRGDAAKITAQKPTTIIFFMTPEAGAILTKELLPLIGPETKLVYDIQLVTGASVYEKILGDLSKINGAITLSPEGDPDQEFINAFHELYPNEEPGFLADFGYDTFNVYLETYDKDNSKWISNLKAVNTKGASGQIRFDKNGIRQPDLVIKKVVEGKLQNVDRLPF